MTSMPENKIGFDVQVLENSYIMTNSGLTPLSWPLSILRQICAKMINFLDIDSYMDGWMDGWFYAKRSQTLKRFLTVGSGLFVFKETFLKNQPTTILLGN